MSVTSRAGERGATPRRTETTGDAHARQRRPHGRLVSTRGARDAKLSAWQFTEGAWAALERSGRPTWRKLARLALPALVCPLQSRSGSESAGRAGESGGAANWTVGADWTDP